jgi:cystathionine beta-lyase
MKKETQCVHSGTIFDSMAGGLNTPIFASSAFEYLGREQVAYPRYFNTPNQKAVVEKVCALEGAEDGVLFSSGMAAISTSILAFAGTGEHIVMMDELYGGTHAFATDEFGRLGIDCTFAATDAAAVCGAIRENTRVVVIESPTNPLLSVIDIRKIADVARKRRIITIIDNTFATPINQNPLDLGMDIVVHSGTKYLGGHSDLCCGIAVTTTEKAGRVRALARHLGGTVNAMTGYLLERSLKTLAIRVERQTENAGHIARFLAKHPKVAGVNYPGLPDYRYRKVARAQMNGFGAMLSFEPGGDANRFIKRLKVIRPAVSLGGIETTICSPAVTSHAKMSAEERKRIGITDSLLRLSVGIEDLDDLREDIDRALKQ